MLCRQENNIKIILRSTEEYIMSNPDRSVEGLKKYLGLDDDAIEELKKNPLFLNLFNVLK